MARAIFVLTTLLFFLLIGLQAAAQSIDVVIKDSEGTALYKVNTANTHVRVPINEDFPAGTGLARDPSNGDFYFTISLPSPDGKIQRSNPDGTNFTDVVTGLNTPFKVAFSEATNELFYIELTLNSEPVIYKVGKSGTPGPTLLVMGVPPLDGPIDLDVDAAGQYVYWTDSRGPSIRRMLTGGGVEQTVANAVSSDLSGIAVDDVNDRVYWIDQITTNVYYADLTQTLPTTQILAADAAFIGSGGLAVDTTTVPPQLYFSNNSGKTVGTAPFQGTPQVILSDADGDVQSPADLVLAPIPTNTPTSTPTTPPEATATATPTPPPLTSDTTIDLPPDTAVQGRTVTLTFQEFSGVVLNSPALRALAAAGELQLRYNIKLTAPRRRDNRSLIAKRNELTVRNLKPGGYSVNYRVDAYQKRTRAQIKKAESNGKSGFAAKFKKVFSTNRSPAGSFVISK